MKNSINYFILSLLAFCLISVSTFAQSPYVIPYQAVARDVNGNILSNQTISLRLTMIDSNINYVDFQETQNVTTNSLGLFSIHIGEGTPVFGSVGNIDWKISGNEYLQVEMDPAGGTSYIDMGTTRLFSVPFAFHANTSGDHDWNKIGNDISNKNIGHVGIGTNTINGWLHVTADSLLDELVVGENLFNNHDPANRIQLGNSINNSFVRAGQDAASYVSYGWRYNVDPALGFGQLTTGSTYHPLALQSFGGNVGVSGNTSPQHKLSIGEPTLDAQNISLRAYNDNFSSAWKGGAAFGYSQGSVIMGELFGVPTIGGHTPNLDAWSDLSINAGGGNVGIGTATPAHKLDVKGNIWLGTQQPSNGFSPIQDALYLGSSRKYLSNTLGSSVDASIDWINLMAHPLSSGIMFGTSGPSDSDAHSQPNPLMVVRSNGNVGIGTSAPTTKLDVSGQVKISGGSPGVGRVLTSDANGVASWQKSGAIAYGFVTGGNTLVNSFGVAGFVKNSNGNYTITLANSPGAPVTFIGTFWDTNAYGFISYYNVGGNAIEVKTRNASGVATDFSFSFAVFSPN